MKLSIVVAVVIVGAAIAAGVVVHVKLSIVVAVVVVAVAAAAGVVVHVKLIA